MILCKKANLDFKEVIRLANTKWNFLNFKPGLVGGHCIGVDPYYLTYKAKQKGYNTKIILSGRELNDRMYKEVEAKHPKAMKHIRYIENFKKKINATK